MSDLHFATAAVHAGRADLGELGVHALPIDLSTTYPLSDVEAGGAAYDQFAGGGTPRTGDSFVYGRLWNPTSGLSLPPTHSGCRIRATYAGVKLSCVRQA